MDKRDWRKPEVRKIQAGAAENGNLSTSDPDPGNNDGS